MRIALPDVRLIELDEDIRQRWGPCLRHGMLVRFNGGKPDLNSPPYAGRHNEDLLLEAGPSPEETAGLAAAGVLWQESVT